MVVVFMFDDFKDNQFIAYSLLSNSIKNNKLSHAYLIDGNNNEYAFDFVMSFVKMIACDYNYSNFDNCKNCNKCSRIELGNYTEVKIVETDSLVIKKEQLLELQSDFSKTSIEGSKRIYVIKDCDKMNKQASNCLLKFLEEPEDNIVAVLFTNHLNNILNTIISRCQVVKLNKENIKLYESTIKNIASISCDTRKEIEEFISNDENYKIINDILRFIDYYEEFNLDIMLYLKKMWYNNFPTRENSIFAILLMVYFYYDVLKYKFGMSEFFFYDNLDIISKISNCNDENNIIKKIDVCIQSYESLKFNVNVNLLIDDMIIKLGE